MSVLDDWTGQGATPAEAAQRLTRLAKEWPGR